MDIPDKGVYTQVRKIDFKLIQTELRTFGCVNVQLKGVVHNDLVVFVITIVRNYAGDIKIICWSDSQTEDETTVAGSDVFEILNVVDSNLS